MATKGSSENITSAEEQNAVRHSVKQARRPKHRPGQGNFQTAEASVYQEGRERQIVAIRRGLPSEVNDTVRRFLDAMLSVYAGLHKSDLTVDGTRITPVAATFAKIKVSVGEETLHQFSKEWNFAKDAFYKAEKSHPLSKYCAQVQAERDERARAGEEHLTQSLGSLIKPELLSV